MPAKRSPRRGPCRRWPPRGPSSATVSRASDCLRSLYCLHLSQNPARSCQRQLVPADCLRAWHVLLHVHILEVVGRSSPPTHAAREGAEEREGADRGETGGPCRDTAFLLTQLLALGALQACNRETMLEAVESLGLEAVASQHSR